MSDSSPTPADTSTGFCAADVSKLAKGAGTTLVGSSLGKGLLFFAQLVLAWLLGAEYFGLYNLGLAVVKIAEIIARLGLAMGGMRFVSVYRERSLAGLKGVILSAVGLSFVNGVLIGAAIHGAAFFIAGTLFQKPEFTSTLKLFCYSIPMASAMTTGAYLMQGFHTTKYTVFMRDFTQPLANLCLILLFGFYGWLLEGAVWAFFLSHLMGLASGVFYLRKVFPEFFSLKLKAEYPIGELVTYSIPLLFVGFLNYFLNWADILLLGVFASASAVGVYRAASQIPLMMTIFLIATNSIYAPIVADLYQKCEFQRMGDMLKTSTRWVTYVTVPLFIIIVFSGREIMSLFGRDFVETGATVLVILAFGQLINCATGGVGYTLTMTGKQKIELGNSVGLVFVSIVLNILLIPRYGAIGAAVGAGLSVFMINAVRVVEIYKLYNLSPFSQIITTLAAPICLSTLLMIAFNIYDRSLVICLGKAIGVCAIFICAFYLGGMAKEDLYVMSILKNRIFNKRYQ